MGTAWVFSTHFNLNNFSFKTTSNQFHSYWQVKPLLNPDTQLIRSTARHILKSQPVYKPFTILPSLYSHSNQLYMFIFLERCRITPEGWTCMKLLSPFHIINTMFTHWFTFKSFIKKNYTCISDTTKVRLVMSFDPVLYMITLLIQPNWWAYFKVPLYWPFLVWRKLWS